MFKKTSNLAQVFLWIATAIAIIAGGVWTVFTFVIDNDNTPQTIEKPLTPADVPVVKPPEKRTSSDLRVTSVQRRKGGVFVRVENVGTEDIELLKGTIKAQVIPEHVQDLQGTPLSLMPSQSTIQANGTVELSARCSDLSVWYITGINVWSDKNDDPDIRNSGYQFSRSTNMFILSGMDKGEQTWNPQQLDRIRTN